MIAGREIFWNIGAWGNLVYPLMAVSLGLLAWAIYRRALLWRTGRSDYRACEWGSRVVPFARKFFLEVLAQQKILQQPLAGTLHLILFWAFVSFFALTSADFIHHYFYPFLKGSVYLWFSLIVDIMGLMALPALLGFATIRYVQRPSRLDSRASDAATLMLLFLLIFTGFLVEGTRIAATEMINAPQYARWSPGGWIFGKLFIGLDVDAKRTYHLVWWVLHLLLVCGTFMYVAFTFSKLTHVLTAPINIFFRRLGPRGALQPIDFEATARFGATGIHDFTWKQLIDLDACTRCGRCQDNCPAHESGKVLSPKKIIQDLKTEMGKGWSLFPDKDSAKPSRDEAEKYLLTDVIISNEALWDCTTCGACMETCPVYIEHVDKIVDMRRGQVLNDAAPPDAVQETLRNMEIRGHPWRGSDYLKDEWSKETEIKIFTRDESPRWLYWVGCTGALVDRNIRVTRTFAGLLQRAGIDFGILGNEEGCCGEPARRMGHELQFQLMAQQNIERMKAYGIKRIVTHCPHCYNTLKHEYPHFGGHFEVLHHSELLKRLVDEKKLVPEKSMPQKTTYHDPCYLGRYNRIMDTPRQCLDSIPGLKLVEMERHRENSFCCGAGGGHAWLDESAGQRINQIRMREAMQTQADIIGLSCPFCLQMIEEGVNDLGGSTEALDLSEVIARSLVPPVS